MSFFSSGQWNDPENLIFHNQLFCACRSISCTRISQRLGKSLSYLLDVSKLYTSNQTKNQLVLDVEGFHLYGKLCGTAAKIQPQEVTQKKIKMLPPVFRYSVVQENFCIKGTFHPSCFQTTTKIRFNKTLDTLKENFQCFFFLKIIFELKIYTLFSFPLIWLECPLICTLCPTYPNLTAIFTLLFNVHPHQAGG